MAFELDHSYRRLQEEAAAVADVVRPFAAEADASSTLHPGVRDALAASDLWSILVPASHGGRDALVDPLAVCVVRETLMATSSHLDSLFALQGIGSYAIATAGTEEQKAAWLPKVATGEALAAIALTEPDAGSDLKSISTTLERRDGGLRLTGRKAFISNAGAAAFYTTLVREADGLSLVLVSADSERLSVEPVPELIAPHVLGDVVFDGVALEEGDRIGAPGAGLDAVLATFTVFRVSVAGAAVGLAQAALEEATRHARQRVQFGRPLIRLGAVAEQLADAWTDVEMARLLTYRAAERAKGDPVAALPHSSMAKVAATEAACRVVDRCVQVMGRFGLVRDTTIERLYRTARPMRIYEGSSEVLRLGIARALAEEIP
ncbi:MAG: acyl-CoA dehydrogenase family protein [Thermoleophilaceae bacterium]